ncbi:DNA polymerase zeta subunit 2 [Armigeres subalbatus]|uniref:DNA polymerase zeta subunit 2 n=1 Tax=Armigeres subalbatus TaxID=124917 RepID=UPI002ED535A5
MSGPTLETDVVIELLEIYINSILFARQLYPAGIFRARRAYNIPVRISIFKPLNEYLARTLRAARELKHRRKLHKVELVVCRDDPVTATLESYVFEVEDREFSLETDENLMELEEQIRKSLLNLDCRLRGLRKLPSDATFKVLLHTTEAAHVELGNNVKFQGFPMAKDNTTEEQLQLGMQKTNTQLLPVSHTPTVGIQLYVEEYL